MKFEDYLKTFARACGSFRYSSSRCWACSAFACMLQVVRGDRYAEIAENQRRRRLPIPAPRGVIFDREGRVIVDSRPTYNVILWREDVKGKDLTSLIEPFSEGLSVDKDILRDYFEMVKTMPAFESITVKQNASPGDIAGSRHTILPRAAC